MENTEFDVLGRIIRHIEPVTGTIYEYEYLPDNLRIITLLNEKNKSNFKTIRSQILIDDEYSDIEVKEFGETYNILKRYELKNKEIYFEQTNIKTGKIHKKYSFWKNDKLYMWTTEYDGNKNVGFYMAKNMITGLTNNII